MTGGGAMGVTGRGTMGVVTGVAHKGEKKSVS